MSSCTNCNWDGHSSDDCPKYDDTPTPPQPDTTDGELKQLLSETWIEAFTAMTTAYNSGELEFSADPYLTKQIEVIRARDTCREAEAQLKAMDKVFELAPDKMFGRWKHDDVIKFFERLKEYDRILKATLKEKTKDE